MVILVDYSVVKFSFMLWYLDGVDFIDGGEVYLGDTSVYINSIMNLDLVYGRCIITNRYQLLSGSIYVDIKLMSHELFLEKISNGCFSRL